MTVMSNEEFAKYVMSLQEDGPFEPTATYNPDGDCIEFLVAPDPFYAERVDDLVTVYYSHDPNEIIGSLIKGISRFCRQWPGFKIEIQDGPVKLEHIFRTRLWTSNPQPDEMKTLIYRKLIAMAEQNEAKAELVGVM